jgi:hypothetical protein
MHWEEWSDDVDKEGYSELYILVDPSKYPQLLGKMLANTGIPFVHWAFAKARIEYGRPRELGDVVMSLSALLFVRSWDGQPWEFYVHPHFSRPRYQYLRKMIQVCSHVHGTRFVTDQFFAPRIMAEPLSHELPLHESSSAPWTFSMKCAKNISMSSTSVLNPTSGWKELFRVRWSHLLHQV